MMSSDPEFNFLEEQEQEKLDKEDFRDDKAVRITSKFIILIKCNFGINKECWS